MKQSFLTSGLAVLAGLAVAATAASAQQPAAPAGHVGEYALAQVDAAELPILLREDGDCRVEIVAASLALAEDETWRFEANVRETCGENIAERAVTQHGTFSVDGASVAFAPHANGDEAEEEQADAEPADIAAVTAGAIGEDEISLTIDKRVFVFRR